LISIIQIADISNCE